MNCGGFSYTEINDEHLAIINSKKDEIETILIQKGRNGKIEHFEIIDLQQQVVAGINYLFKIQLQKDGNEYIQSTKIKGHVDVVNELLKNGNAYKCYCSNDEIEEQKKRSKQKKLPYIYNQKCREITEKIYPKGLSQF